MARLEARKTTMRRLELNMSEITMAMEDASRDMNEYYLDTETGRLEIVDADLLLRAYDHDESTDGELLDWQQDIMPTLRAIAAAEDQEGKRRYECVPQVESWEAYDLMVKFAGSVEDGTLRRLLAVALDGKGAFRRFKDVLYEYPEERERWFRFKNGFYEERATEWLHALGIEPVASKEG